MLRIHLKSFKDANKFNSYECVLDRFQKTSVEMITVGLRGQNYY